MPATSPAWGGATLTVTVSGTDVSCDVLEVTVDRSKNRLWDPPDAGTCQVTLDLGPAGQPPSRGPVGAIVRVRIAYGAVSRYLFTGTVQRRRLLTDPGHGDQLVLDCVDEFEQLARVNRRAGASDVAVGGGDTVDERLDRWLDAAGSVSTRALDPSDYTCPAVLIDGNVLRQLQVTALADGGDFVVTGAGVVTFLGRQWRNAVDVVSAVFSDRLLHDWVPYSSAAYHDDLDEVQNDVTGIRRDTGGTAPIAQTATNSSSITTYGSRGDSLDELELEDDTQVANRVAGQVTVAAQPNPRFDSIVVQPAFKPSRSWPRTIPVTFGSLIAANRVWADNSQSALYGHVIGERWSITPVDATVEFRCTGTGTWDAEGPPRVPIGAHIDPATGLLCVPVGYPCDTTSDVVIKDAEGTVLATYPPGSLCYCETGGGVVVPDGGAQVCYVNEFGEVCTDIEDPRLSAVLWFDVLEPGPDLIERVDGDAVDPGAGFSATRLDVIPGDFDAIDASTAGGPVGGAHSTKLETTSLTGGWSVELYYYLTTHLGAAEDVAIVNLDTVQVHVTTAYQTTGPYITQLEVITVDAAAVYHLSGPIANLSAGDWHHVVIQWDAGAVAGELVCYIDGVEQ